MRRLLIPLALLAVLIAAAPASAKLELPLGHAGRWITDADGRVTILQGYNMVYKRPPSATSPSASGATTTSWAMT